jgi:Secretion system C-terminal sorting domain
MKRKSHLILSLFLLQINVYLIAQCTDSGKPFWSPLPGSNATSGTFNYPSTAAIGTIAVSPSGSNAYNNPSTTSLVTNMAFFTKQARQSVSFTFNTPISKATTMTTTNVSMVSTNESFKLSSLGRTEAQVITAKSETGNTVFPIWSADSANVEVTGLNNNEIKGRSSTGFAAFSFAVPILSLSINGYDTVTAISGVNVILQPVCAAATIPVELSFFKAKFNQNSVKLNWQTAFEKNNKGFDIERSIDAQSWDNIGFVKGQGNATLATNYAFEDKDPLSILIYYRLKQIDFDGKESYSNIESVASKDKKTGFKIYPNPAQNFTTNIEFEDNLVGGTLQIINTNGSVLKTEVIDNQLITLDLSTFPSGLYFVKIFSNQTVFSDKIIVKQ